MARIQARALAPAGLLYGAAVRARFALTRPYRSRLPVICVGGFTMGGAGKTPLAVAVARLLTELGARFAFLTRGYGGEEAGPHLVDPSRDAAARVGDEPLLLAQSGPVAVARRRPDGARLIETMGVDAIVMDDGMQNPTLHKDLTIAAVDGGAGLGNGRVFPAGPLRAGLGFQLGRADAAVIIGDGEPGDLVERRLMGQIPALRARIVTQGDASWLAEQEVVAFAGIGRPEKFFETLKELGARLKGAASFPDHHVFTEDDAIGLLARASAAAAMLVTTAKDKARLGTTGPWAPLGSARGALAELAARSRAVDIALKFREGDAARLRTLLSQTLAESERRAEQAGTRRTKGGR
jgi:tetraacyldisaccharide 4'-kinase